MPHPSDTNTRNCKCKAGVRQALRNSLSASTLHWLRYRETSGSPRWIASLIGQCRRSLRHFIANCLVVININLFTNILTFGTDISWERLRLLTANDFFCLISVSQDSPYLEKSSLSSVLSLLLLLEISLHHGYHQAHGDVLGQYFRNH